MWFNFYFPGDCLMVNFFFLRLNVFTCVLATHVSSSVKCLYFFCLFFNLMFVSLLGWRSSLYILGTSPFSDMWFYIYFIPGYGLSFPFLMISFEGQFLWVQNLMKFIIVLFSFSFMGHVFDIISKSLPNPQRLSPMFYYRSFIVLPVTFIMIHLELIYSCIICDKDLSSFFGMCISSFPSTFCWKKHPFPIELPWTFLKSQLIVCKGLLIDNILFHCFTCLFSHQHHAVLNTVAL